MRIKNLLNFSFVIGVISYGFYLSKKETALLRSCSRESKAIVIDKYRVRKKGYRLRYNYMVNGIKYSTTEVIRREQRDSFAVGDTILIKYSCEDNNVSSID